MKKGIYILLLCCLLILMGCNRKINNNTSNEKETEKYVIEKEEKIEEDKELLELVYHDPDKIYFDWPEAEVESIDINYKIDFSKYESKIKKDYENEESLTDLVKIIKDKLNIIIDDKWYYVINEYNKEEQTGMIQFLYYIDNFL